MSYEGKKVKKAILMGAYKALLSCGCNNNYNDELIFICKSGSSINVSWALEI